MRKYDIAFVTARWSKKNILEWGQEWCAFSSCNASRLFFRFWNHNMLSEIKLYVVRELVGANLFQLIDEYFSHLMINWNSKHDFTSPGDSWKTMARHAIACVLILTILTWIRILGYFSVWMLHLGKLLVSFSVDGWKPYWYYAYR